MPGTPAIPRSRREHVAADLDTGIITDEKRTMAAGQENSDPAVAEEFLAAEAAGGDGDGGGEDAPGAAGSHGSGDAAAGLPGTATPATAPGTCAARSRRPAMTR